MPKRTDRHQWKGGIIVHQDTDADALTEKQAAFVALYVANGGNAEAAAKTVGIGDGAGQLLNHKVRTAIEVKRDIEIKTNGATQAWAVMQSLLTDPAAPAQVRFQAARWTLEASGHGLSAIAAAMHMGLGKAKKDQHEMTVSELEEMVDKGRKQLDSMKVVLTEMSAVEKAVDIKPE